MKSRHAPASSLVLLGRSATYVEITGLFSLLAIWLGKIMDQCDLALFDIVQSVQAKEKTNVYCGSAFAVFSVAGSRTPKLKALKKAIESFCVSYSLWTFSFPISDYLKKVVCFRLYKITLSFLDGAPIKLCT